MGLLKSLLARILNFVIFFLLVVFIPGLPPNTHFPFSKIEIKPPRELKGPLELNNLLDNSERILEGRVYGPEALIARKDEIYTGIHGGEIVKITGDRIRHVAKFGHLCDGIHEENKCGRPLGLAFDTLGDNLIAADAYFGIWEVNLSNGKKKQLISPDQEFEGKDGRLRKAKTFNSVAVAKNGDIYWTDSSSDFGIEDGVLAALSNPSGRLFVYNRATNESKLLLDQLYFANGVALSPNEDFIVVAETMSSRLIKYYLKGSKKGQFEIFLDGLPGLPDNLTPDVDGLWVPLVGAVDTEHPQLMQILAPYPILRMFLVRFLAILELPFQFFNNFIPIPLAQKTIHFIGNFESFNFLQPNRASILRLDWNGNIRGSLHGFDKSVGFVSHVLELDDNLFLGSPFNKFIAKIKLPRTPQVKIRNVRYEGAINMEPVLEDKAKLEDSPKIPTTTSAPKPTTTSSLKPSATTSTPKPETSTKTATTMTSTVTTTTTTKPPTIEPAQKVRAASTPIIVEESTPSPIQKPVGKQVETSKTEELKAEKPSTSTTTTPRPTTKNPKAPKEPIPIREEIPTDTKPPKKEKLKVIKKGGAQGEL